MWRSFSPVPEDLLPYAGEELWLLLELVLVGAKSRSDRAGNRAVLLTSRDLSPEGSFAGRPLFLLAELLVSGLFVNRSDF